MSIKRYCSKYKKLAKLNQPIWLEKGRKIKKFNRQKWDILKKSYEFKKYKFFNQDTSTSVLAKDYEQEKSIRLKKTYKFILHNKQRLQLYYGYNRLKYFQLKNLSRKSMQMAKNRKVLSGKVFMSLLENRLQNVLYRLNFVSSLMQARKLVNSKHIRIEKNKLLNCFYSITFNKGIQIDPSITPHIIGSHLRMNYPFFYFTKKKQCREMIYKKQQSFSKSFFSSNKVEYSMFFKKKLLNFKKKYQNN